MSLLPREFHALDPKTDIQEHVQKLLTQKNKSYSQSQSIKGIITAGPVKSVSYAIAKIRKRLAAQNLSRSETEMISMPLEQKKDSFN